MKRYRSKSTPYFLHALGLQTWNPGYVLDLNFTTWSVSVEIFFYLIFPFLLKPLSDLKPQVLLIRMLLVWLLQSHQHFYFVNHISNGSKKIEEFISDFPLWHLGTFLWGMGNARLLQLELVPKFLRGNSGLVFFGTLLLFLYIIYIPNPILRYIHSGLLSPLFALHVISLFYNQGWLHKTFSQPALSKLGEFSYGIFAFKYTVWHVCTALASDAFKTSSLFFFLYLGAVLGVSFLVSTYFEKPIMTRWKKTSNTT